MLSICVTNLKLRVLSKLLPMPHKSCPEFKVSKEIHRLYCTNVDLHMEFHNKKEMQREFDWKYLQEVFIHSQRNVLGNIVVISNNICMNITRVQMLQSCYHFCEVNQFVTVRSLAR